MTALLEADQLRSLPENFDLWITDGSPLALQYSFIQSLPLPSYYGTGSGQLSFGNFYDFTTFEIFNIFEQNATKSILGLLW